VSVSATASSASFNGDDVSTEFDLAFRVLEEDDLLVRTTDDDGETYTTLVLDDDYTLDGTGPDDGTGTPEGVTLTLAVALPTGTTLAVERNTDPTQESTFQPQGALSPITISRMPDKNLLLIQELIRRVAALEGLADLVDVADVANGVIVESDFTTSDPVEDTFAAFTLAAAGGESAIGCLILRATNVDDPNAVQTEPPAVQWTPGALNQVNIKNISGLAPSTQYSVRFLVLPAPA
jgi:hypothetical protein